MASIVGHGLVAATMTYLADPNPKMRKRLYALAVVSAMLPDADVIGFKLGVPYGSMLGHRGLTHSILFAAIWATIVAFLFFKEQRRFGGLLIFFATLSHGLLDAMTTGGLGVGFFIPLTGERYFLPWRPIAVSPIAVARYLERAVPVLLSELLYIGAPCLVAFLVKRSLPPSKEIK